LNVARLDRAIQYAVTFKFFRVASGILDHPLSRVTTVEFGARRALRLR